MLPWIFLLLHQLIGICQQLMGKYWHWGLALVLVEAVLLGQLLIVSPDIVLVAAFLTGINLIIGNKAGKAWKLLAVVLVLSLVSTRGWMAALSLFLLDAIHGLIANPLSLRSAIRTVLQKLPPFIPGGLLALAYLFFHYQAKGWISFHPDSPWAASFDAVSPKGIARNIGLVGWRLLDVGRLTGWLILAFSVYQIGLRKLWKASNFRLLSLGILLFLSIIVPMVVVRTGLTGPRYLLPAILLFDLLVAYMLLSPDLPKRLWKKSAFALVFISLLAGILLIYPHRIAQAWDATPVHYHYYQQVENAVSYLKEKNIPLNEVGTVFPSVGPRDWRNLDGEQQGFKPANLAEDRYLFVSIIHNDWSDEQLDQIEKSGQWKMMRKQIRTPGIWSTIYKRVEP